MQIIGKVTEILPIEEFQTKDGKTVRKQMFRIEGTRGKIPDSLGIALFGDMITNAHLEIGKEYTVLYDAHTTPADDGKRYYNDLSAWKVTPFNSHYEA